ncbi:MAG: TonB-dependent receptor domain-containing protein, partial [Polyangiales bacterium]
SEVGLVTRFDHITQRQRLIQAPQNEIWDERLDATIDAADIGGYLLVDWLATDYVRIFGGLRLDGLFYSIDNRLGNAIPATRPEDFIPGFSRTAFGVAGGPRGTLELLPLPWLQVFLSYGRGFRSPQANQLGEGESAPFTTVNSWEGGLAMRLGAEETLKLRLAAFRTSLSQDAVFDPQEATLERVGPSRRTGAVLHAHYAPWQWLVLAGSLTGARAILTEPPPATAEQPEPALEPGNLLPFVPPVVVRVDAALRGPLTQWRGHALTGHFGLGGQYLSARPLPYSEFSDPVFVVDARLSARWRLLELALDAYNLFNHRYAANEFVFVSDWNPGAVPSRLPARHIAAGPPLSLLASLRIYL